MQSLTLIRAAMLGAAFLTGCGTDLGPTTESAVGVAAAATDRNQSTIPSTFAIGETNINPCNGELSSSRGRSWGSPTSLAPGILWTMARSCTRKFTRSFRRLAPVDDRGFVQPVRDVHPGLQHAELSRTPGQLS